MRFVKSSLCTTAILLGILTMACDRPSEAESSIPALTVKGAEDSNIAVERVRTACVRAKLPAQITEILLKAISEDTDAFQTELMALTAQDKYLWAPVDKVYALPAEYEPVDLMELVDTSYLVNRKGLYLRVPAAVALEAMANAARSEGITLVASSAYRSYAYQEQLYTRIMNQLGQVEADRESARPGHSEHQLGLVLDFGSIDDSFAETAAGRWLKQNAHRFGWILSYPEGLEEVTGYRWESWHYRYVGLPLLEFIDRYFMDIKHYAFRFLYQWAQQNPAIYEGHINQDGL